MWGQAFFVVSPEMMTIFFFHNSDAKQVAKAQLTLSVIMYALHINASAACQGQSLNVLQHILNVLYAQMLFAVGNML